MIHYILATWWHHNETAWGKNQNIFIHTVLFIKNILYQTPEQSDIGPPRAAETLIGTSLDIPDEMIPHLKVHKIQRRF